MPILVGVLSIILYTLFAYYLERTEVFKMLLLYGLLFFCFLKLYQTSKYNFKYAIGIGIVFRLIFIAAIPNLSQDFYRFIWDGRMIFEGLNPYLFTPESFISSGKFPVAQAQELYNGMGQLNASHYTNYPPLNQLCFTIAAYLSNTNILGAAIVLRSILLLADIGIVYFGQKLLKKLNLSKSLIFLYFLNPFIIIELSGNLHFEGLMLFFLVWALYLLHKRKLIYGAFIFACSIAVKLIPLIFLPLFFKYFKWRKSILFYAFVGMFCILMFLPFYSPQFIDNYSQTVALWFQNFEFNASIYYILRAIGYSITGYNEIAIIGKLLAITTFVFVIFMSLWRKNQSTNQVITNMLLVLTFYLFTTTTVHPWYVSSLVLLCVFTPFRYPLAWSFMVVLSYFAYITSDHNENLWLIGLEYIVVYSLCVIELYKNWSPQNDDQLINS
ncbi:MAG: mannosyltransferase [Bacteroidetes bacterium MedPE-SWsnd-G2]|nr:MAG: mannosyltransferase [Bacteroidetes bacterium MedPE-SWsnd-G2]